MALQTYGGEGMVAVVRGLPDSSLAVTLLDGRRTYTLQPDANYNRINSTSTYKTEAPKQASGMNYHRTTTDASAQANDDRFASSYQISHCQVRPTSPAIELSEFPPQKSSVSPGHENFEVGGLGSGDLHHSPRFSGVRSRSRAVKSDKRVMNTLRSSRQMDSFANSLRKYPTETSPPEESTDLIENLINYTQSKFTTKEARNSNHQTKKESNFAKVIEDLKNSRFNTSSKNLQTYTRTNKTNNNTQETPTKDILERNKRTVTKSKVIKDNTKYDYLSDKVNKSVDKMDFVINNNMYSKCMDVRYLCDMTRCIRERIKQIVEDSDYNCGQKLCPKHRERLIQHRKEHHSRHSVSPTFGTAKKQANHNNSFKEAATSCQSEPLKISTAVSCYPSSSSCNRLPKGIYISKSHSREIDQKDLALSLETDIDQLRYNEHIEHRNSMSNIYEINNQAARKHIINGGSKSEEIIPQHKIVNDEFHKKFHSWLQEVPIFQNESQDNKILRDEMIGDLEEKLLQLCEELDADDLETQIRIEAEKTLKNLPIWHPQDEEDENIFIDKIVSNLINRIIISGKDSYGSYSNSPIIVERSECKHVLCFDEFKSIIYKWVIKLPLKHKNCNSMIDRKEIVDCLDNCLRPLALRRPKCKSIHKHILRDKIKDILRELPLRSFCCSSEEAYNQLSLKLADPLSRVTLENEVKIPTSCCQSKGSIKRKSTDNLLNKDDLEKIIIDEVTDILEQSHLESKDDERNKTAKDISKFLLKTPEVMRGNTKQETNLEISKFLIEMSNVNLTQANDIANIIIDKIQQSSLPEDITGTSKLARSSMQQDMINSHKRTLSSDISNTQYVNNNTDPSAKLEQSIRGWIEDVSLKIVDGDNKVKDLTERLAHVETHNNITESRRDTEVKSQVNAWLKEIQLEKPLEMPLNEATEVLVDRVKETRKEIFSTSNKKNTYIAQVKELVSHWLYELPIDSPINIDQLKQDLVDIVLRNNNNFNDIKIEIGKILETMSMTPGLEKRKSEMTDKLINRLKRISIATEKKPNNEEDNEYIILIENEIRKWSKELPFQFKSSEIIEVMIKELAGEVHDRHRYLESNPNKTLSEEDENNYLEFQIYRWLHKVTSDDQRQLYPYIKDLINVIDILKTNRNETKRNTSFREPVTKIQEEIINWFNEIPQTLKLQLNSNECEKQAIELAENIARCKHLSDKEKFEYIDYEINEWVKNINENNHQTNQISEIVKSLKERIMKVYDDTYINIRRKKLDSGKSARKFIHDNSNSQTQGQINDQSESPNIFIQKVSTWCNELPILTNNTDRDSLILNLVLHIFQRIWYFASNPAIFQNNTLLRQTLDHHIKILLDDLPPSEELNEIKDQITNELIDRIIEHKDCFKKDAKQELYNYLINWCHGVMSNIPDLPDNVIYKVQTDLIFKIICKAFELTDNPHLLDDDNLFQDLMCEEIEKLIDNLPKTLQLQSNKHILGLMLSNEIVKNKYVFIENQQQNYRDHSNLAFSTTEGQYELQDPEGYKSFEREVPASSSITQQTKRNSGMKFNTPISKLQSLKEVTPEQPIMSKPSNKSNISHISQQLTPPFVPDGVLRPNQPEHLPSYASNATPSMQSQQFHQEDPNTSRSKRISETKQMLLEEIVSWCNQLPFEDQYREELEAELLYKILYKARTVATDVNLNANMFEIRMSKEIENMLNNCPFSVKFDKHPLALQLAKIIQSHKHCFRRRDSFLNNSQFSNFPQNPIDNSQFNEVKQGYSGLNQIKDPHFENFERQALVSSTPFKLNNSNTQNWPSEPDELETTNEDHYTSLHSTKYPTQTNNTTSYKPQNKSHVSSAQSYEISQRNTNSKSKPSFESSNIAKSQIEAGSQTEITNINDPANTSQSTLRNTVENRSLTRQQNPHKLQIDNVNRTANPYTTPVHEDFRRTLKTNGLSNENIRGPESSKQDYVSERLFDTTNKTTERPVSPENNFGGFGTPSNQMIPNETPQRPRKRRLGPSRIDDEYDVTRFGSESDVTSFCRCKDNLTTCPRRIHGFCMRPSCVTCNSDMMSQCRRCCGMHCPLPSFLYFQ